MESGQNGPCCALGNLGLRIFCGRETGHSITWTAWPGWVCFLGVWTSITHTSLWSLFHRKQGKPRPLVFCSHTPTACACRSNHFSVLSDAIYWLFFPLGWKGFSFVWSRGTNLTECIRKYLIGIVLGFYWGWNAQTKCNECFRLFWVISLPKVSLGDMISSSQI